MNKTFKEILNRHCNWDLLVVIRSNRIRVFDVIDTESRSYWNYIESFEDVECNYVMFNYGRVNLLIVAMNTDIDDIGRC